MTANSLPNAGTPIFDSQGFINPVWHLFFASLFEKTGGANSTGFITDVLAAAPITRSGVGNPTIGIDPATPVSAGSLSALDKAKLDTVGSGAAVSTVGATAPIISSGGTSPVIGLPAASSVNDGYMAQSDKRKLDALNAAVEITADVVTQNTTSDGPVLSLVYAANSATAPGVAFLLRLQGGISSASSSGTLSIWVKVGATKVLTLTFTIPVAAQTNRGLFAQFSAVVRTIGAGGTLQLAGFMQSDSDALNAGPVMANASVAFDTTVSNTLTLGWAWSVANAANIATAKNAAILIEKQP